VSDESEFELGIAGSDEGLIPEGAAGGTGPAGGRGGLGAGALFALVVIAALVASVGVLLLSLAATTRRRAGSGAAAENDPDEPEPDLATVGRTAGQAADRIESSDADNEVYRAWRDMTAVLDVDRPASSTPAEFAAAAVDAGVDEEPVETLTEVFERVRYGGADATDDREQRAIAALRQIEERHGAGDSESHGDSTHPEGSRNAPPRARRRRRGRGRVRRGREPLDRGRDRPLHRRRHPLIGALAVVQGFDTRTSAAAATGGPPTPASRSAGRPRPCPGPTSTSGSAE